MSRRAKFTGDAVGGIGGEVDRISTTLLNRGESENCQRGGSGVMLDRKASCRFTRPLPATENEPVIVPE